MVSRVLEQQQSICAVLAGDWKNWYRMPSANEFSILEAIVEVFKPLSVFTDALSSEDHVTISAVPPLRHQLLENVLKVESGSNGLVSELKLFISRNLSKWYEAPEVIEILDKCSFLDPRFKVEYLQDKECTLTVLEEELVPYVEDTSTAPRKRVKWHHLQRRQKDWLPLWSKSPIISGGCNQFACLQIPSI